MAAQIIYASNMPYS